MGYKRLVASLTLVACIGIPLHADALNPSSACRKAGLTRTTNGIKSTCIKSGKKLVWSKGVANKTGATATTTTTTTPPSPTSFANLVENYKGISYAAWQKSREKVQNSKSASIEVNVVLGPTTKQTYSTPEKAFALVSRHYAGYLEPSRVDVLTFNFADRDWAVRKMDELMPNKGSRWIYDVACSSASNCGGGGAFSDGTNKFLVVIATDAFDDLHKEGTLEAHEFTHVIQQAIMKAGNPWPLVHPWPPSWYWEGQAEYTQHAAVFFESFDMYTKRRRDVLSELFRNSTFDKAYIESYFVINGTDEWRKAHNHWRQYDLGSMFVEILTALKGPDSTMEMWRLAQTGVGFSDAFKQIYGTSFESALPIMAKAMALQLGR
jgi:hypothetical protein